MTIRQHLSRYVADRLVQELHPEEDPKTFLWNGPIWLFNYNNAFTKWIVRIFLPAFNKELREAGWPQANHRRRRE